MRTCRCVDYQRVKRGPKFVHHKCGHVGKMQTVILRTKWSIVIILNFVKSLHLHNASTGLDKIWIGDVSWSYGPRQPTKCQKFKYPRWMAAILKNEKTWYPTKRWNDFNEIWHNQAYRFSGLLDVIMTMFWKKIGISQGMADGAALRSESVARWNKGPAPSGTWTWTWTCVYVWEGWGEPGSEVCTHAHMHTMHVILQVTPTSLHLHIKVKGLD